MYLAHWGLERSPFADGAAPRLFYEGEIQAEAAARLRFVVRDQRQLGVLVGRRGVGKSLVLRRFGEACRREGRCVAIVNVAGLSVRELLWQTAAQFTLGPSTSDDAVTLFRRIAALGDSLRWQRETAVLAVDDADQAGPDVRSQLVRLLQLGGDWSWLSMVLAAPPERLERLGAELLLAADLRIDLEPWSEAETIGYLQHALLEAGCDRPVFDDEALAAVYAASDGVPRLVNRLADHALLAAAAEGLETVHAATIQAAHDALGWLAASAG